VPTDGRGRKKQHQEQRGKRGPVPAEIVDRKFYGATYLLDQIGQKIGLNDDLKYCFPSTHKQIRSMAYYLIMESDSPLFRFEKWSALHKHPYNKNIISQRSSELFAGITEEDRMCVVR
jgi:hypothetical protein